MKHLFVKLILILTAVISTGCEIAKYPYFIKSKDHGMLWVANSGDNTVTCIDRHTDKIVGTYEVGPNPSRTAVDLDGNCWVGSRNDDSVYFVTPKGNIIKYTGFNAARGVALDKAGNVWIANSGNNTIQKIDNEEKTVSDQIVLQGASYLYGALVDSKGFLWVADYGTATMYKYDTSQFPDPAAYDTVACAGLYGFTIDTNNTVWAAGLNSRSLIKIDAEAAVVEQVYPIPDTIIGGMVCAAAFDINGNIWLTNDNNNSIIRFNPETEEFKDFAVKGKRPHGLGAGDSGYIYSINLESNNISKIDIETGKEVETISVGTSPYTYSDLTGFVYRHVTLKENKEDSFLENVFDSLFKIFK